MTVAGDFLISGSSQSLAGIVVRFSTMSIDLSKSRRMDQDR
jgi:hypothetical protein